MNACFDGRPSLLASARQDCTRGPNVKKTGIFDAVRLRRLRCSWGEASYPPIRLRGGLSQRFAGGLGRTFQVTLKLVNPGPRSEERRVGKECRSGWAADQ